MTKSLLLAFPYKQLPVLEVDGKQLAQSRTILRYLSQELGLYGKDKWESWKLDELMELQAEFHQEIYHYYGTIFGYAEGSRVSIILICSNHLFDFRKSGSRKSSFRHWRNTCRSSRRRWTVLAPASTPKMAHLDLTFGCANSSTSWS
jgi:hypothetical protein